MGVDPPTDNDGADEYGPEDVFGERRKTHINLENPLIKHYK